MTLRDKGPFWINLGMSHSTPPPLPSPLGLTHPINLQRTPFSGSIPQGSHPFSLKTRDSDRVESQSYLSTTESSFSLTRYLMRGGWMHTPALQLLDGVFNGVAQELSGRQIRLQAGTDSSCQECFQFHFRPQTSTMNSSGRRECQSKSRLLGPGRDWHRKATPRWLFLWTKARMAGVWQNWMRGSMVFHRN